MHSKKTTQNCTSVCMLFLLLCKKRELESEEDILKQEEIGCPLVSFSIIQNSDIPFCFSNIEN